jgi:hypothetical protein
VLCAREKQAQPKGSVRVREACKRGEVAIGSLSLDVTRAGDAATLGGLAPSAFESAGRRISTTVSGIVPSGSRIVYDEETGFEVVTGVNAIQTIFANRNVEQQLRVRGLAMYNADNTTFVDFVLEPGATQSLTVAAVGTNWFDVTAVTRASVESVRRFRVTCNFDDSSTPANVAWSCIGTR